MTVAWDGVCDNPPLVYRFRVTPGLQGLPVLISGRLGADTFARDRHVDQVDARGHSPLGASRAHTIRSRHEALPMGGPVRRAVSRPRFLRSLGPWRLLLRQYP